MSRYFVSNHLTPPQDNGCSFITSLFLFLSQLYFNFFEFQIFTCIGKHTHGRIILRSDYEDADLLGALHNSEDDNQPRFIEFRAKIEISSLNWA